MSYGLKRWALGYWCGMAATAACYEAAADARYWVALAGLAVVFFCVDCLIAEHA